MGVEYGYKFVDETAEATVKRLITPHQIDKIKLNPSRSNFSIIGKRSEIFSWMGNNGHLEIEYQGFFSSMENHLTIPLLLCELYIEDVHVGPSTRMRLEIRPDNSQLDLQNNQPNFVERKKATNGITLLQLSKAWDCCDRSTSDYE
ncbi:3002_t:CDS:2 [Diversispora eburnea]|uniref:3002_t:CDS:1 n=1 Tax=Diversispora eburnea TaxID=1213867 RepID=A0A9N8YT51_9GLOM|nr:3002_t:CDS:2 [Diversispora eburnea]